MAKASGGASEGLGCFFALLWFLPIFAAWFQHLYTCFTEDRWGILIAGAIFFPIGIIHGFGIWFGFWH
jgi:hypothetical protein